MRGKWGDGWRCWSCWSLAGSTTDWLPLAHYHRQSQSEKVKWVIAKRLGTSPYNTFIPCSPLSTVYLVHIHTLLHFVKPTMEIFSKEIFVNPPHKPSALSTNVKCSERFHCSILQVSNGAIVIILAPSPFIYTSHFPMNICLTYVILILLGVLSWTFLAPEFG